MSSRDLPPERRVASRPVVHLVRAASATLRAFTTGASPANAARAMYGHDAVTDFVLRGASQPAAISGTASWAQSLAAVAVYDLIASATSLSAAAAVIDRALKLNMSGVAELHVPGRALSAAAAGQWIGEGIAAPVRAMSFANAAVLRPRRLDVLSVVTREMAESSNIEAVVRQTLGEATGLALDLQMFSADTGDAAKPPGLFAGVAPLTPTAGGG